MDWKERLQLTRIGDPFTFDVYECDDGSLTLNKIISNYITFRFIDGILADILYSKNHKYSSLIGHTIKSITVNMLTGEVILYPDKYEYYFKNYYYTFQNGFCVHASQHSTKGLFYLDKLEVE